MDRQLRISSRASRFYLAGVKLSKNDYKYAALAGCRLFLYGDIRTWMLHIYLVFNSAIYLVVGTEGSTAHSA